MKINNFRGDLSSISTKTATLTAAPLIIVFRSFPTTKIRFCFLRGVQMKWHEHAVNTYMLMGRTHI